MKNFNTVRVCQISCTNHEVRRGMSLVDCATEKLNNYFASLDAGGELKIVSIQQEIVDDVNRMYKDGARICIITCWYQLI